MNLPDFLHCDTDGEIRIIGHRIRLVDIAARYREGYSPETILVDFYPTLSLALIHKVIAHYLERQSEVDKMIASAESDMAALAAAQPTGAVPTLAEMRGRLAKVRPAEAS